MGFVDLAKNMLSQRGADFSGQAPSQIIEMALRHGSSDFTQKSSQQQLISPAPIRIYGSVQETWRSYCSIKNVRDLETHTMFKVGGSGYLSKVKENGSTTRTHLLNTLKLSKLKSSARTSMFLGNCYLLTSMTLFLVFLFFRLSAGLTLLTDCRFLCF